MTDGVRALARSSNLPWGPNSGNPADPAALAQAGDLVVANVGNTNVRLVRYAGGAKVEDRRIPTAEAAADPPHLAGGAAAIVSVVPAAAAALEAAWRAAGVEVYRATADTVRLAVDYDPPTGLGADRLVNALALWRKYGAGIVIDCGTATTLTLVDEAGTLRGGAIMPGLATARDALWQGTAQLPAVPLEPALRAVGRSTLESIQIGLVDGHVGAIVHLAARMRSAFPHVERLVITGGWGELLAPLVGAEWGWPADFEPDLTLEGTRLAWVEARER